MADGVVDGVFPKQLLTLRAGDAVTVFELIVRSSRDVHSQYVEVELIETKREPPFLVGTECVVIGSMLNRPPAGNE